MYLSDNINPVAMHTNLVVPTTGNNTLALMESHRSIIHYSWESIIQDADNDFGEEKQEQGQQFNDSAHMQPEAMQGFSTQF